MDKNIIETSRPDLQDTQAARSAYLFTQSQLDRLVELHRDQRYDRIQIENIGLVIAKDGKLFLKAEYIEWSEPQFMNKHIRNGQLMRFCVE